MPIEAERDRRAEVLARAEAYIKDPWIAATLVVLGESVIRLEPRRDDPLRTTWVFRNPNGATTELVHAIYQQSERSLVPAMLLRQAYKDVLSMSRSFESQELPYGTPQP